MSENKEKKIASLIVSKARSECREKKINSYIAIGAFIDEVIKELVTLNSDEKVAKFLESVAKKVRMGVYRKK
jgi:transcriptional regulatory protein LevR